MTFFQPGMILTADRLNHEGPQTWVPGLSATTTSPLLGWGGNYMQTGVWWRWGPMVHAVAILRFGASGVNSGSGFYRVSLPIPASSAYAPAGTIGVGPQCGSATLRRQSPFEAVVGSVQITSVNHVQINIPGSVGSVRENAPWTWSSDDAITLTIDYLIDL